MGTTRTILECVCCRNLEFNGFTPVELQAPQQQKVHRVPVQMNFATQIFFPGRKPKPASEAPPTIHWSFFPIVAKQQDGTNSPKQPGGGGDDNESPKELVPSRKSKRIEAQEKKDNDDPPPSSPSRLFLKMLLNSPPAKVQEHTPQDDGNTKK